MDCVTTGLRNMNFENYANNRGYDEIPQRPIDRLKPLRDNVERRKDTFKKFPKNAQVSSEALLNDGFFYIGDGNDDRVQCAFCGGIFKNWHKDDNVHEEHKRIFSRCPLANDFLNHGESGDLQVDGEQLHGPSRANFSALRTNDLETDEAPRQKPPRHQQYALYQTRLESFKGWPQNMNQKPEDLARAGLYYTGEADKALCYYCGGALVEWEPEDVPAPEHDQWFPDCILAKERAKSKIITA